MADVSKLKRKGLGAPPPPNDYAKSLAAPEIAPAETVLPTVNPGSGPVDAEIKPYVRRDGRSARKTNRTLAFATRVTPEFDETIRTIAEEDGLYLSEVLEQAVEALLEKRRKQRKS